MGARHARSANRRRQPMPRCVLRAIPAVMRDRCGATAVEYGLLMGGIALAIVAAVFAIGDEVVGFFDAARNFSQGPG
jgi:Flp pilus assembly pilin Flp